MKPAPLSADFTPGELAAAIASGYGAPVAGVVPLAGNAHSVNFKILRKDGSPFVAKLVPDRRLASLSRLLAHLASVRSERTVKFLFGGRILEFGNWRILALEWIGGEVLTPDRLDEARVGEFLDSYRAFAAGLSDDGAILPPRDGLAVKKALEPELERLGLRSWLREIRLMDDGCLSPSSIPLSIIHGDLHHKNIRFPGPGGAGGAMDIEELRFGTPAEDIVRYILCAAERRRLRLVLSARPILRTFSSFVRRAGLSRNEWLFAIDGYLLRKMSKRLKEGRTSTLARLEMGLAFRFYHRMRETVCSILPAPPRGHSMRIVKIMGGTVKRFMGGTVFDWNGKIRFTCDPACRDYDWLCVYDEIPGNRPEIERGGMPLFCPRENTILATQEPVSIKSYNRDYIRQFAYLLTNRPPEADMHPGRVAGEGYMVWYTGRSFAEERGRSPGPKTKKISAVCSSKQMRHTGHADRYRLVSLLASRIPGLDWFGKGVKPVSRKCEALDPYEYTVAVENHVAPGHWTEKVADAIVCGCLPFYAGDPDLGKALPPGSFIPIPAGDPETALGIVERAIASDERSKRAGALAEARRLLLEKYNLFAQVASTVESAETRRAAEGREPAGRSGVFAGGYLRTRRRTRLNPVSLVFDLLCHVSRFFVPIRKEVANVRGKFR